MKNKNIYWALKNCRSKMADEFIDMMSLDTSKEDIEQLRGDIHDLDLMIRDYDPNGVQTALPVNETSSPRKKAANTN